MRTTPHIGDSVNTPECIAFSNRKEFASQRTGLASVSYRVDQLDGSAGRVLTLPTATWVGGFSTSYGSGFLKGNHELKN